MISPHRKSYESPDWLQNAVSVAVAGYEGEAGTPEQPNEIAALQSAGRKDGAKRQRFERQ